MFETFESRVLMANTISPVTAKLSRTGTLFVTGTEANEKIQIIQSAGGGVAVRADNTTPTLLGTYGLTTRIKQDRYKPLFDLNLVKRIVIAGAGGDDEIAVNIERSIPVNISGGAGNDQIKGAVSSSRVFGDAGDDTIDLATGQRVETSGNSVQSFTIDRTQTGSVRPNYVFNSGRGVINATGNRIDGGDGNDTLYTRGTEDSVYGGAGDDKVIRINEFDSYFTDLPALPAANNTNIAPSRAALFSVESVVSNSITTGADYVQLTSIPSTIVVRRSTIDALRG